MAQNVKEIIRFIKFIDGKIFNCNLYNSFNESKSDIENVTKQVFIFEHNPILKSNLDENFCQTCQIDMSKMSTDY